MKNRSNPIVMVAPYLPESGSQGAAHKIESVLRILARSGRRIIFINSAHRHTGFALSTAAVRNIAGVRVLEITPFTWRWRPAGKLANILTALPLARRVAALRPSLVWIYNSYAFEARFALLLSKLAKCRIVLEMEDLPLARKRGLLNLKPLLDSRYLPIVQRRASLITCVNQSIQIGMGPVRTMPLPYIMSPFVKVNGRDPLQSAPFTVGYFGHLSVEKGASIFTSLHSALPSDWRITITGRGRLAEELHRCAARSGGRMKFFEDVPDEKLYELLTACDVAVNPHTSIESMGEGVFPFKVLEAVASGRLLISTELPPCGFDLQHNVMYFNGTVEGLHKALDSAPEFLRRNLKGFHATVARVRTALSEEAIYNKLKKMEVLP
jgi:glycosyltransferase involved in cell wall biosynthesis